MLAEFVNVFVEDDVVYDLDAQTKARREDA